MNGLGSHKYFSITFCMSTILFHFYLLKVGKQSIFKVILALGDYMNVQCHACIGGTNIGEDIRKLDYGQHVVSGTPGRVFGKPKLVSFSK